MSVVHIGMSPSVKFDTIRMPKEGRKSVSWKWEQVVTVNGVRYLIDERDPGHGENLETLEIVELDWEC